MKSTFTKPEDILIEQELEDQFDKEMVSFKQILERDRAGRLFFPVWEEALNEGICTNIISELAMETALKDLIVTSSEANVIKKLKSLIIQIEMGNFSEYSTRH